MTVLLFAPLYPPQSGGAAQYVAQLERVIERDIVILSTPCETGNGDGVYRSYSRKPSKVWRGLLNLLRVLQTHDVEVAHVHPHFPHWSIYKPLLNWHGVPIVFDVRDHLYIPSRIQGGAGYLAATEAIKRELQTQHNITNPIRIAPVVVNASPEYTFSIPGQSVAYVGDLTEAKGIHLALDACRDLDTTLHVAGDGPLRNVVQDGACVYHGELVHGDALALIAGVDCLVLPSRSEGRPRVVLEALQCGTTVVASDAGDITLGKRGTVVTRDSIAIRNALEEWISTEIEPCTPGPSRSRLGESIREVYQSVP